MIPIEIEQKIKAFVPRDRNMSSPTAACIRSVIEDCMWYYDDDEFHESAELACYLFRRFYFKFNCFFEDTKTIYRGIYRCERAGVEHKFRKIDI